MRHFLSLTAFVVACFLTIPGCQSKPEIGADLETAERDLKTLVDELDARRTSDGAHERVATDEVQKEDPWGTSYKISYSQSPKSDVVTVRSAGPDRVFHTEDDVVAKSADALTTAAPAPTPKGDKTGSREVAKAEGKSSGTPSGQVKTPPTPAKRPSGGVATEPPRRESVREGLRGAGRVAEGDGAAPAADATPVEVACCDACCECDTGCRLVRRWLGRRRPSEWVVHWEVEP